MRWHFWGIYERGKTLVRPVFAMQEQSENVKLK